MTGHTRIPPTEVNGAYGALVTIVARTMMGHVPESIGVLWHHTAAPSSAANRSVAWLSRNRRRPLKSMPLMRPTPPQRSR